MLRNYGDNNGQWMRRNQYCPKCKATGNSSHDKNCNGEKVSISSTARFPRKTASKKVWDEFYRKFVLQEDLKEYLTKQEIKKKPWKPKSR